MERSFPLAFCLSLSLFLHSTSATAQTPGNQSPIPSYGNLPLLFEPNQGQADPSVQFVSHGEGYVLELRGNEATFSLRNPVSTHSVGALHQPISPGAPSQPSLVQMNLVRLSLIGSRANPAASKEDPQPTRTSYFLGNNPALWKTAVPNYGRIRYRSIYNGIDLVYYGNQRRLEHDFIVAPHANPAQIVLNLQSLNRSGAKPHLDPKTGDLMLETSSGELSLLKPITYQQVRGKRVEISSTYKLLSRHRVSFSIARYDRSQPLVIDPVLTYSTFLGGSGRSYYYYGLADQANGIAVDKTGNAYIVGTAQSVDFPTTTGALQRTNKAAANQWGPTVFISKLNPSGTALVYSTFLGGSGQSVGDLGEFFNGYGDFGTAIALDAENNAYLSGYTFSSDFPTTSGAVKTTNPKSATGTSSAFLAKLDPTGSSLVFSTYIGGSGNDFANSLAVDASGNSYLAGATTSADFLITNGALQTTNKGAANGVSNAFVTKINSTGTAQLYSTFLGGSGTIDAPFAYGDQANSIAIDSAGDAYVAGNTASADFPVTAAAFQKTFPITALELGPYSAFVTKLDPQGISAIYSTYLGAPSAVTNPGPYGATPQNSANSIVVDSQGEAYVAGQTFSLTFPTTVGVLQTNGSSGGSAYVTKFTADGSSLIFSTYLGGLAPGPGFISFNYGGYSANAIQLDKSGNIFIAGYATDSDFPLTTDSISPNAPITSPTYNAISDAFVAKMNPTATALEFSGLLGGTMEQWGSDQANALAVDSAGNAYIAGATANRSLIVTPGAYQTTESIYAQGDAFIAKFNLAADTVNHYETHASTTASAATINQGSTLTLHAVVSSPSGGTPTGSVTFLGAGTPATVALDSSGKASWNPPTTPLAPGPYSAYLEYSGDSSHLTSTAYDTTQQAPFRIIGPPASFQNLALYSYHEHYDVPTSHPLSILALDSTLTPVPNFPITFSGSGLVFTPSNPLTNASGIATGYFTPIQAGTLTATASSSGTAPPLQIPITVLQAPLYIQARNTSITYGQTPPSPLPYNLIGFLNGDSSSMVSGAPALSTTASASSPVGDYPITIHTGTLAAQNYSFLDSYSGEGSVQVFKAPLLIHPASFTIHAGDPLPAFTYTLSGFLNGDNQATATTGAASITTPAPLPTRPGRYYIIGAPGTLQSHNYTFSEYVPDYGILTVLP